MIVIEITSIQYKGNNMIHLKLSVLYLLAFLLGVNNLVAQTHTVEKMIPLNIANSIKLKLGINDADINKVNQQANLLHLSEDLVDSKINKAILFNIYSTLVTTEKREESPYFKDSIKPISIEEVKKSLPFLQRLAHKSKIVEVKALAYKSIAYAFPADQKVSEWLRDFYLFETLTKEEKLMMTGCIKFGRYRNPLVVRKALNDDNFSIVMNAISCVRECSHLYPKIFPDLIVTILSLEERALRTGNATVANRYYLMLGKAISSYEKELRNSPYVDLIPMINEQLGGNYIKEFE